MFDFIKKYNDFVKLTHENMRKEGFEKDELIFNIITLSRKPNKVEDLIDIFGKEEEVALVYFRLLKEVEVKGNYKFFGFNSAHNFYYVIDKSTDEILEIDMDKKTVMFNCAVNIEAFFNSWCKIIEFDALVYLNSRDYKSQKTRLTYQKSCTELAGGYKYSKYYESLFIV